MRFLQNLAAWIGEQVIYAFIRVFGRKVSLEEMPWLAGPMGEAYIGDSPYAAVAEAEGLELERHATQGGLIPDFGKLGHGGFDPESIHPEIRDFYENTAEFRMDVWAQTYWPASWALWLLVTTISRKVNQLNFPVDALETAAGMSSEILLLKYPDGRLKYTGWHRKIAATERVLYTGFYMIEQIPGHAGAVVKVVFPMPDGNATVLLRPESGPAGEFILDSKGSGMGDAGFYRLQRFGNTLRAWRIRSLNERFRIYVDADQVMRCDHSVRFLGLPVLKLHYRIEREKG